MFLPISKRKHLLFFFNDGKFRRVFVVNSFGYLFVCISSQVHTPTPALTPAHSSHIHAHTHNPCSPTHTHSLIRHGIHPVILQETNSNSVFHIPSPSISLSPFFSQAQSFILTNTLTLITHAQAQAHAQAHAQTHKLALQ